MSMSMPAKSAVDFVYYSLRSVSNGYVAIETGEIVLFVTR